MQRSLSTTLASRVGRRATVQGWVHRRRRLARSSFLIIRDRGGLAQVVLGDEDGRAQLDDLGEETVVCVDGMVTANAQAPGGCRADGAVHHHAELTGGHATCRAVAAFAKCRLRPDGRR
ncbi:MAG: OB-fold nucleic acid binding domain-containing protein [Pseudonocardiaceae bacterium]